MFSRRQTPGRGLFANPYVVLADLLIATFFVMILYAHLDRLSAADPSYAEIERFKTELATHIRAYWGSALQDEADSKKGRGRLGGDPEKEWWTTIPAPTAIILKQDASYVKMIPFGVDEETAIFLPRSSRLTPRGQAVVTRIAQCLAGSEAAHQLVERKAIVSISIEGHCAEKEWSSREEAWTISLERAREVATLLERVGNEVERRRADRLPNSPRVLSQARFTIQGRAHYQNLPHHDGANSTNRRVQIEVRFTQRYAQ